MGLGIATVLTTSVSVLTLSNQVFALSMQNGKIRSQVAGTHSPGKAQNGAENKRLGAILMDNISLFGQPASNSGHVGHPVTALNSGKTLAVFLFHDNLFCFGLIDSSPQYVMSEGFSF